MITTALDFSFDISTLGSYIGDALGSLGSIWVIPAGLIIAAAVLMFAIKMLKYFSSFERSCRQQERHLKKSPPQGSIGFQTEPDDVRFSSWMDK